MHSHLSMIFSAAVMSVIMTISIGSEASAHAVVHFASRVACDSSYDSDVTNVFKFLATAQKFPAPTELIKLRYQYEDNPVPVGCDIEQQVIVRKLALFEDELFIISAVFRDATHVKNYTTLSDIIKLRLIVISSADTISRDAATADATAVITPAATNAGVEICSDPAFSKQVIKDLRNVGVPVNVDGTAASMAGLKLIKLRYKYEDTVPPIGCENDSKHIVQYILLLSDKIYLTLSTLGNKSYAAGNDDFIKNILQERIDRLYDSLKTDFNLSSATVAPTMSATAAHN